MKEILFLTGLPRSGTKLLRDLLNNHDLISIPEVETTLIPYFLTKFGKNSNLNDRSVFEAVCSEFERSVFYKSYLRSADYKRFLRSGKKLNTRDMFDEVESVTWNIFFERIIAYYGPKEYHDTLIIGDKTPGYINQTDILLDIWPKAKIIHIVRDPRDYACSVNNIWNKNIFRASDRWNNTIMALEKKNNLNSTNYLVVYYENLLDNPDLVLNQICDFLQIEFQPKMKELKKPSENYGQAKGQTRILRSNKNKYLKLLNQKEIRKIEQIVAPGARLHGYELENKDVQNKCIPSFKLLLYKLADGLRAWQFHINEKGLLNGTAYFIQFHKQNI